MLVLGFDAGLRAAVDRRPRGGILFLLHISARHRRRPAPVRRGAAARRGVAIVTFYGEA